MATFYYDLASPDAYLAAERVVEVLDGVVEWEPVLLDDLPGAGSVAAFRCAAEEEIYRAGVERRAAQQGLQPLRWPAAWPSDSALAMRVATYAKQIGRGVAFSLAAFRQAFAGGRDLADTDTILLAAAACEIRPAAVLKATGLQAVRGALEAAGRRAVAAGVREVPAVQIGPQVFQGPDAPEQAAAAVRSGAVAA